MNMQRRYFPAQIEKGESSYGIWFADFPGCVSVGDTIAEAIEGAHEALALHTTGMIADGEPLPAPSMPRLEEGSVAVAMIGVALPGRKKRVNVMIDEGLLAAIDAVSANRSQFLEKAARKELAA
jgi:predicted RNase H-like HicB family nuclease